MEENTHVCSGAPIAGPAKWLFVFHHRHWRVMNASLYFELVDAVTKIDGTTQLRVVADRIATTKMHPLERRVLERALRARTEALDLQQHLLTSEIVRTSHPEEKPLMARG